MMKIYCINIYLDDGMSKGTLDTWVMAQSPKEAGKKVINHYNSQYDTYAEIRYIHDANPDTIFTQIAANDTIYVNK